LSTQILGDAIDWVHGSPVRRRRLWKLVVGSADALRVGGHLVGVVPAIELTAELAVRPHSSCCAPGDVGFDYDKGRARTRDRRLRQRGSTCANRCHPERTQHGRQRL